MRRLSDRVNRRKPRGETLVSSRKRLPTIQSRVIAIKPSTGFRGRASGAKIPCARCIPWYPLPFTLYSLLFTLYPLLISPITHSPFPIPHYSLLITLNLFVVAPTAQIEFANATIINARYLLCIFEDGTQDMTQHLECKSPVSQLGGIR